MTNTKFELRTSDTKIDPWGRKVTRIRALKAFSFIEAGALGGYIQVERNLSFEGDAWVEGDARVEGDAVVAGNALRSPIVVQALNWPVTITDSQMTIGCQTHTLFEWQTFTDGEIAMDGRAALKFWRAHKSLLLGLAEANGREVHPALTVAAK